MYVCMCYAITDRQIQEAVQAGASSLKDLKNQLGVATCCGCCEDEARQLLAKQNLVPVHQLVGQRSSPIRVHY